jgi:hypothetical protein
MTGFEVLYDRFCGELSMLNSMLPFFVIVPNFYAIFRCYRFDVPVFFDVLIFDIPVFSRKRHLYLTKS